MVALITSIQSEEAGVDNTVPYLRQSRVCCACRNSGHDGRSLVFFGAIPGAVDDILRRSQPCIDEHLSGFGPTDNGLDEVVALLFVDGRQHVVGGCSNQPPSNPDPDPKIGSRTQLGIYRAQTIVAPSAARPFCANATQWKIDIIMDDHQRSLVHRNVADRGGHTRSTEIHIGGRFQQRNPFSLYLTRSKYAFESPLLSQLDGPHVGQTFEHHEPGVVSRSNVATAGVSQTDHQKSLELVDGWNCGLARHTRSPSAHTDLISNDRKASVVLFRSGLSWRGSPISDAFFLGNFFDFVFLNASGNADDDDGKIRSVNDLCPGR